MSREKAIAQQEASFSEAYASAPGFGGSRWGFQIEDPTVLYWLTSEHAEHLAACAPLIRAGWDSADVAKKLYRTAPYSALVGKVNKFASPSLLRAAAEIPDAPVIEWLTLHIEHNTPRDEWAKGVDKLRELLEDTAAGKGYKGLGAGWSQMSEHEFVVLVGWESKEAHTEWKSGLDSKQAEAGLVLFRKGVKSVKMVHVAIEGSVESPAPAKRDVEAEVESGRSSMTTLN